MIKKKMASIQLLAAVCVLAALLLGTLAGCSSNESQVAVDIEPEAAAQTILEGVTFRDTLVKAEGGAAENYYRLDDSIAEYAIYISGSGGTAEEIAVLKAADSGKVADVKAIAERRVENLKLQFENYVPEEMVKLGDPVLVTKGDTVILVLADDSAAAKKVVESLG